METRKLESMITKRGYEEIVEKVKEYVGKEAFEYIFPAVCKALEEGSGKVREEILIGWLDVDTMRVCSHCGEIMQEGWYLDWHGYACSDECCMALMSIDKEEYEKYSIFKPEIIEYLEDEGEGRTLEDLTKEEIDEITSEIVDGLDAYYYTDWD